MSRWLWSTLSSAGKLRRWLWELQMSSPDLWDVGRDFGFSLCAVPLSDSCPKISEWGRWSIGDWRIGVTISFPYAYHNRTDPTFPYEPLMSQWHHYDITHLWHHSYITMTSFSTYDIILTSLWPHSPPMTSLYSTTTSLWPHSPPMTSLYSTTTSPTEHYKYSSIS